MRDESHAFFVFTPCTVGADDHIGPQQAVAYSPQTGETVICYRRADVVIGPYE